MNTLLRSIFVASLGLVVLSLAACAHDPNEDKDPIFGVVGGGQNQQQGPQGQQSAPQGRIIRNPQQTQQGQPAQQGQQSGPQGRVIQDQQ